MASDPIAPENHRGVAMFVVLGMVIFFTMLGIMGLEMASKDSQVSGSLVDIKTKEEAAWGGLNLAIGTMQANPAATVAQLQQFIADSSASASSKHQWFRFASGTFTLAISKPDTFATLAASGDPSGVIVRVVALYIGDVNGSDTGSGITITLESTGKGRNGDPLTIFATYRMLGVDVPLNVTTSTSGNPGYAFYLNGGISNGNMGTAVNGSVFFNGTTSLNSGAPLHVEGRLLVNGGFTTNDTLIVDSNAVIHGALGCQTHGARFRQSLILDEITGNTDKWVVVDSSLVFRGIGNGVTYFHSSGGLKVGKDLVALQADAFKIADGGALLVGRNAWMYGFAQQNGTTFSVGNNLEIVGNPTQSFSIPDGAGTTVGGYIAARGLTSNLRFIKNSGGSHAVGGNIYSFSGIDVNTTNFSSGTIVAAGGLTNSNGNSFTVNGDMWLSNQVNVNLKPSIAGNLVINGTLAGGFSGWTLTTPPTTRIFRYNTTSAPSPAPTIIGSTSIKALGYDSAFPSAASVVGAYPTPPDPVLNLHYTASDVAATTAANAPDTMFVDNIHSPAVNAKVVPLTNGLCDSATSGVYDNWSGTQFNALYAYLSSKGRLLNGYMVIDVTSSSSLSNINPGPAFTGKALWIIEKNINVNGNWPNSANSNAIQVLYVKNAGSLGNWGFTGTVYGYIHFENAMTGNGQFSTAGATLYGAIEARGAGSNWTPNSSNLTIIQSAAVFNDINTNLPGVFHAASGSGASSTPSTSSSKTLTIRGPASAVQFIRIGEYR